MILAAIVALLVAAGKNWLIAGEFSAWPGFSPFFFMLDALALLLVWCAFWSVVVRATKALDRFDPGQ